MKLEPATGHLGFALRQETGLALSKGQKQNQTTRTFKAHLKAHYILFV